MRASIFARCRIAAAFALVLLAASHALNAATTEEQIIESPLFPEPLLWVGSQAPTVAESEDLLAIITNLPAATWKQDMLGYIAIHPSSPWNPAIRANLGIMCRQCGDYTGAFQLWSNAWQVTKTYTNGSGKAVGDVAAAHWSQLLSSLGRSNELAALFNETAGRSLNQQHLAELWRQSKEGYQTMLDHPSLAYRCGVFGLIHVAYALGITNAAIDSLKDLPSTGPGFSMAQLLTFSQQRSMGLSAVVRTNGTNLVVPSVVHWSQNHYAAITASNEDMYWVKDPTFGTGLWMSTAAINAEASGKFLVPSNQIPSGWRAMTQTEMDNTWGRGQPNNIEDWKDHGCDMSPGGRGAPAKAPCPPCAKGMPRWWVTEPYVNLWIADEPLSYTLSTGEKFSFRFTYKERRSIPSERTMLPTFTARSTNTLWEHNFLSHIQYWDPWYEARNPGGLPQFSNWTAMVFLPGGGVELYTSNSAAGDVTASDPRRRTRLEQVGSIGKNLGYTGFPTNNYLCPSLTNILGGFRLAYPDGSYDWYTLTIPKNTPSLRTRSEALLTMRTDPFGRTTRICYEGVPVSNPLGLLPAFVRIKHIIDPDGRTNTFLYHDNIGFPKQIKAIYDPYNRSFSTTLFGALGSSINGAYYSFTDAAQNTTQFGYDPLNTNRLLHSIGTPYGTTFFYAYDVAWFDSTTNLGNLGGDGRVNRSMAVEEPDGAKHLFMYRFQSPDYLPLAIATAKTPTVNSGLLLDTGGVSTEDFASLIYRNSFYWGPRNFPLFSAPLASDVGALSSISSNQVRFARWRHWLDSPSVDARVVSDRISLEREPAPSTTFDSQLIWYSYWGKQASHRLGFSTSGDAHQLALIAELLPDNSTRYEEIRYRSTGENFAIPYPRIVKSTFTETDGTVGVRTRTFEYYANKIDLFRVAGEDGDIEETYYYDNTNHQVTTFSNAVAELYTLAYDPVTRRLTSATTPAGLTVTYNYYPTNAGFMDARMLASIVESPINRINSFTYANGLPQFHTNELGLRMGYTWDGLDRLTRTDYLDDGTFSTNFYNRLDLIGRQDRAGNWTRFLYNNARRLVAVTNANTNVTRFVWCGCGALEFITNAFNQTTTLGYDQQSRQTSVSLPDNSSLTYAYDPAGRLASVTDGLSRAITLAYNHQGLVAAVSNAYGRVIGVVYDREDRPIRVTDASGVTVTNAYDNLDRVTNRAWPGAFARTSYSYAGTNITSVNPLNQTTRTILDAALRLLWQTNANSEVTKFGYNPAGQLINLIDGRNQLTSWNRDRFGRITNKVDALAREMFRLSYDALDRVTNRWTPGTNNTGYAFDAVGNLRSVTYSNAAPLVLGYNYDALNRLTNMTDAVGATRFTYTATGQPDIEDGPWVSDAVSRSYVQGQRSALSLEQPSVAAWAQSYNYDAARRLQSLLSPAGSFGYVYGGPNPASALVRAITLPQGMVITNAYDALAQLTNTTLLNAWKSPVDGYGYSYDKWSQRTNVARLLGAAASSVSLSYDPIGQLTAANAFETDGTARLNEKLGYAYDAGNNLLRRTNATLTQSFTPDNANQLSTLTRSGTLTVAGYATRPISNVNVSGQSAAVYKDLTYATTSGITPANGTNSFAVVAQSTTGTFTTNQASVFAPNTVTFQYDARGNLTNDGVRLFIYDGENQLTNITVAGSWRSQFVYDGLNRLRIRREYSWTGSWSLTNETRYLYDGLLVLQERDGNNLPVIGYTRGIDLSGSLQGAGGIGGLFAMSDQRASVNSPTNFYYHTDGSGNVTALINPKSEIVARYLYDPFGNVIARSGPLAEFNRYRFSSKETHANSGLSHYGLRFYDPNLQRWINQDPIGEAGGVNLHGFVGNDGINFYDSDGLAAGNSSRPSARTSPSGRPGIEGEITREIREGLRNGPRVRSSESEFFENIERDAREQAARMNNPGYKPGETYLSQGKPPPPRPCPPTSLSNVNSPSTTRKLEGNTTRQGITRDNPADWRATRDLWDRLGNGEILSPANRDAIAQGRTPQVDDAWVRFFPEDAGLMGELISPHHIQGFPITVPLPATRHMDAHMPGGYRFNPGGPGAAVPFYPAK